MSAAVQCRCPRCAGGVMYHRVGDYLRAHQLTLNEYVLDGEIELVGSRRRADGPAEIRTAVFNDGSEVMVEIRDDGRMLARVKPTVWAVFGPPAELDAEY